MLYIGKNCDRYHCQHWWLYIKSYANCCKISRYLCLFLSFRKMQKNQVMTFVRSNVLFKEKVFIHVQIYVSLFIIFVLLKFWIRVWYIYRGTIGECGEGKRSFGGNWNWCWFFQVDEMHKEEILLCSYCECNWSKTRKETRPKAWPKTGTDFLSKPMCAVLSNMPTRLWL